MLPVILIFLEMYGQSYSQVYTRMRVCVFACAFVCVCVCWFAFVCRVNMKSRRCNTKPRGCRAVCGEVVQCLIMCYCLLLIFLLFLL